MIPRASGNTFLGSAHGAETTEHLCVELVGASGNDDGARGQRSLRPWSV